MEFLRAYPRCVGSWACLAIERTLSEMMMTTYSVLANKHAAGGSKQRTTSAAVCFAFASRRSCDEAPVCFISDYPGPCFTRSLGGSTSVGHVNFGPFLSLQPDSGCRACVQAGAYGCVWVQTSGAGQLTSSNDSSVSPREKVFPVPCRRVLAEESVTACTMSSEASSAIPLS